MRSSLSHSPLILLTVAVGFLATASFACSSWETPFDDDASADDDDVTGGDDDASADDDVTPDDDSVDPGCNGGPRWDRHDEDIGLHQVQTVGAQTQLDYQMGAGIAVADFDGNGWPDLYATAQEGPQALYFAQGDGTFIEGAAKAGAELPEGRANGATAADYDGDGDFDLLVWRTGTSRLLQNQGTGTFLEVGEEAGLDDGVDRRSMAGALGDFDGDGDLDLFVANYYYPGEPAEMVVGTGEPDGHRLLRNQGDGTFVEATHLLPGSGVHAPAMQGAWEDLDGDGDLDLLAPNDLGAYVRPSTAWRNDGDDGKGGWSFTDVGMESGLSLSVCIMGIAFGDGDSDGDRDALVSIMPGAVYLESLAPWVFVDSTFARGYDSILDTPEHDVAWNALFEDFNNDGREDLFVQYGYMEGLVSDDYSNAEVQPDVLLWGTEEGLELAEFPNDFEDPDSGRGLAVTDWNGDGTLDVAMGVLGGLPRIFLSRPECVTGHWLGVEVYRPGTGNVFGVGAVVTVEVGGRSLTRVVDGGSRAALSSSPPGVHFGLGEATEVDRVTVRLPGGLEFGEEKVGVDQRLRLP